MKKILIKKFDGSDTYYDENKLKTSLRRSGASEKNIKKIVSEVDKVIFPGVSTRKIYSTAYNLLRKNEKTKVSLRYSLRRAISEFGPSGFPFEQFLGKVFKNIGFKKVQIGIRVKGKCVSHEVDLIGHKDDTILTAELKFHNKVNLKTDLKVILYVKERFDDMEEVGFYQDKTAVKSVITNTKFSQNAIKYGECRNMRLISWSYPEGGNLHDLIIQSKLNPITCIPSLSKKQKEDLLVSGYVLCSDILKYREDILNYTSTISKTKMQTIIEEAEQICACHDGNCKIVL